MIEAIAIGTGPSFYDWIRLPRDPTIKLVGCGRCTLYVNNLDYYVYADSIHEPHLPQPHFHPTVEVWAHSRRHIPNLGWNKWDGEIPHGGTSGGMAISLACLKFQNVGLIGFDGYGLPNEFVIGMNDLLCYWQKRGKTLYTLMPNSMFNNRLKDLA